MLARNSVRYRYDLVDALSRAKGRQIRRQDHHAVNNVELEPFSTPLGRHASVRLNTTVSLLYVYIHCKFTVICLRDLRANNDAS